MMRFIMTAAATAWLIGCASSSQPSQPEVASGQKLTAFQKSRLLGHYSTESGKSGFILDRTREPWRARFDGETQGCTLETSGGPGDTKHYACKEPKRIWLRVDGQSGEVLLFQGPNETQGVRVIRDADAEPL